METNLTSINQYSQLKLIAGSGKHLIYDCNLSGQNILDHWLLTDGISLSFLNFNTEDSLTLPSLNPDAIVIMYCHKGRLECEFNHTKISYLSENQFLVMRSSRLANKLAFPLKSFDGFALIIDFPNINEHTFEIFKKFNIDLKVINDNLDLKNACYLESLSNATPIKEAFEAIYKRHNSDDLEYFKIKALELLYCINQLTRNETNDLKYYDKDNVRIVKDICAILIEHMSEKLSLVTLAKEKGMNLSLFHKVFLEVYDETPYAYVKRYKMNVAADILRTSKRKINEIAQDLGYNNASKFSIAFESVHGILPKDYRKNYN